ncbi:MAG: 4-(cytidine 5'-diphospho)-2-C-methyl-D-erythritol kinase [Spirochaetaceae bacterium]|jgi:4-diphosphocytidyl-2-C-methyl-D-erythritol kinase|nr:4-(cytidine 5'-diphospho)-2-C-methyl-D-erythritol kinase [Spirochaetaceae bacterium]
MVIEAPCKINLHLAVGAKRGDGFHDIDSIFLALNLCDALSFEFERGALSRPPRRAPTCAIQMDNSPLPPELASPLDNLPSEKNLVCKAVRLFWQKAPVPPPPLLKITVKKRIPSGAGLGGGSSDAAAALAALNEMTGRPLSPDALRDAAAELGSDVPFFLERGAAIVTGRGEKITPIPAPECFAVLINPLFASNTARAFRLLDASRRAGVRAQTEEAWRNDFLPVFLAHGTGKEKAAYRAMICDLTAAGADIASLSGSGSTCFGLFPTKPAARAAARALQKKWPWTRQLEPFLSEREG